MRLVIDCFKLVKGSGKSIGIYNVARDLVNQMAKSDELSKKDGIVVIGSKYNREDFDIAGVKFLEVHYNPKNKIFCILWELLIVPRFLRKLNADCALFPRGFAPFKALMKGIKSYVIVHDMIPFYYDKYHHGVLNPVENFYIMWRLKASSKSATKVITVSESSKEDIMKIANVNSDKVKVIYSGCPKIDFEAVNESKKNISLPEGKYISAITSMLPHKNAVGIIESYKAYYKKSENPMDMLVIGLENTDSFDIDKETASHIICHKFFEKDSDMQAAIAKSQLFLFLSKKEGFGFPPVEAMKLSVPVITSGASSLEEIVTNNGEAAALIVDPDDYEAVADKLLLLENDQKLSNELIVKGSKNANRFRWSIAVHKYIETVFSRS